MFTNCFFLRRRTEQGMFWILIRRLFLTRRPVILSETQVLFLCVVAPKASPRGKISLRGEKMSLVLETNVDRAFK